MKVSLKNVRLAFPVLWEARKQSDDANAKAKFSATFILAPDNPAVKAVVDAIQHVAKEKWADKHAGILAKLKEEKRLCFSRTPKSNASGEIYDGFEGMCWVSSSSDVRPGIFDRDPNNVLTQRDGRPYGGCFVNANIELWAQDNKFGKRVNATLRGVQFIRDGDAFASGRPASSDEFEDMSAEEGGESGGSAADI